MFNQQNYQGICEMSKGLSTSSTIEKLNFKPFERDHVNMGSKDYPSNVYDSLEFLPNIGEEIRLDPAGVPIDAHGKLLVSSTFDEVKFEINNELKTEAGFVFTIDEGELRVSAEKKLTPEQQLTAKNLMVTWSKNR